MRRYGSDAKQSGRPERFSPSLPNQPNQPHQTVGCGASDDITKSGIKIGAGKSEVVLTTLDVATFTVTATSESDNKFIITKGADGVSARTCTVDGKGGCKTGGVW